MGRPARSEIRRAMFWPCSASGIAQPMMTSSISLGSRVGTRSTAPRTAIAPRSSGRVKRSVPLGAFPTAVRTALTTTASFIICPPWRVFGCTCVLEDGLISKRLAVLERESDALDRLGLSAKREEGLALQIEQRLLAQQSSWSNIAAGEHARHMRGYLRVMLTDVCAFAQQIDAELECRQNRLAGRGYVGPCNRRRVPGTHQAKGLGLGVAHQAAAIHRDRVDIFDNAQRAGIDCRCRYLGHGDVLEDVLDSVNHLDRPDPRIAADRFRRCQGAQ